MGKKNTILNHYASTSCNFHQNYCIFIANKTKPAKAKTCSFTTEGRILPQTALASLLYETEKRKIIQ